MLASTAVRAAVIGDPGVDHHPVAGPDRANLSTHRLHDAGSVGTENVRVAVFVRQPAHDEEVARGRDREVRDHEVHARERGRLSGGEVDLHDLRDGAAALLLLHQIGERAVTQEVGRGLLALLTPGEGTLVRAVFRHQPDMVVAFAVRHERDGLPVRRNGRLGVVGGLLAQLHGVRAGDRLEENLAVTGALRVEYYRLTVGRERRVAVRPR